MMSDNTHYATIQDWDDDYFLKHGSFEFLNRETVAAKKGELFKADYTGFGWMLIKKGVFESLPYPWFQPLWVEYKVGDKTIRDFSMEDVAFCKMIKEKGYDVWIDPNIIVGHEKMMVL
jgi:hypothetical protein